MVMLAYSCDIVIEGQPIEVDLLLLLLMLLVSLSKGCEERIFSGRSISCTEWQNVILCFVSEKNDANVQL